MLFILLYIELVFVFCGPVPYGSADCAFLRWSGMALLLLGEPGRGSCAWVCMEMWYGADGEPMDMKDAVDDDSNALAVFPEASKSDREDVGSASAWASTLSSRERLMNSSPDGWEATAAEARMDGRCAAREEARLGKWDNTMVLLVCGCDIGVGNRVKRDEDRFRTSTARAATSRAE